MTNQVPSETDEDGFLFHRESLDVGKIQGASWVTVLAVIVAGATVVMLFNLNQTTVTETLTPMFTATGGLVEVTLVVNLVFLVVIVWGLILRYGGLEPQDVGLTRQAIPLGIVVTGGTWLLMQLVGVTTVLIQGESLTLNDSLRTFGLFPVLGGFIAQLFGNALYEEIVYRAFLFPQLMQKFAHRPWPKSSRTRFILALLLSQFVFALIHVPGRLTGGVAVVDLPLFLAAPFVLGILFALVYYRTGNLFVTVGLHALVNDPVLLVDAGGVVLLPLLLVILVVLFAWPSLMTVLGAVDTHVGSST